MKYNLIGKQFTKDGHTMFYEDVLRDLKRKEHLERENINLKKEMKAYLKSGNRIIEKQQESLNKIQKFVNDEVLGI